MCWQVAVVMFYMFIERDQIHVQCAAFVEDICRRVMPEWLQATRTQDLDQALGLEHESQVYGCTDAARAWWERVEKDVTR